jgi:hypothetical protein
MSIFPCAARLLIFAALASLVPRAMAQRSDLLDPQVTPATIQATICQPYYADRERFPLEQEMQIKGRLLQAQGVPQHDAPDFSLERRVPVVLGGNPAAQDNFELRRWSGKDGARRRARVAVKLKDAVCNGKIGLRAAQAAIAGDWQGAFKRYVHAPRLD